jgi:serine/threonine protein kinase
MPSTNTDEPPVLGLVAGKYELVSLIGRGGMGSVWEARHVSLGKHVAIKFIDADYIDSQEARARFENEARAAASIESKHAIEIIDHGVTPDGKPYIVMERLIGEPLDKRIDRLGRLPLQETAKIIQQVCRALGRAHERGIVHRDLKPENIFLVRAHEEDDEIAKVLDFGIAKMKAADGASKGITSSTKTGAVLGTPFFMSPEQARGLRGVDFHTDMWSLGVIAYKCVTGLLPFDGESVGDLLVKICTAPLPIPSHVLPGLPPGFDAWFARALDREPTHRFNSVHELSEELAMASGVSVRPRSMAAPNYGPPPQGQYGPPPQSAYGQPPHQGMTTPHGQAAAQMSMSGGRPMMSATAAPSITSVIPERKGGVGIAIAAAAVTILIAGGVAVFALRSHSPSPSTSTAAQPDISASPPPIDLQIIPAIASASASTAVPVIPPLVHAPAADSTLKMHSNKTPTTKLGATTTTPSKAPPATPPSLPPATPAPKRASSEDPGY